MDASERPVDLTARLLGGPRVGDAGAAWAASGAMALTGRADGPALAVPAGVTDALTRLAHRLRDLAGSFGVAVTVDGPALLGERAALRGTPRQGTVSVGGSTRLLPADDGWIALALPRTDDAALAGAWLALDPLDEAAPWPALAAAVAAHPAAALVADGASLGLAIARVGERVAGPLAVACRRGADEADAPAAPTSLDGLVVVDLSSLWAGPLCTQLLADAGATVVKVESRTRPDAARDGDAAFFDLLNAGKLSAVVDLAAASGRAELAAWLRRADVVLEASRPRALAQLGLSVHHVAPTGGPRVWCRLTAHGRTDRVGFGDDAAVAGGLVAWEDDGPRFVADAAADPATGLTAAVAVLDRLAAGGHWTVDVDLAGTAAFLAAGPVATASATVTPGPPRARPARGRARPLGADDAEVRRRLGP